MRHSIVQDEPMSGRESIVDDASREATKETLVLSDSHITVKDIMAGFRLSHRMTLMVLHDQLPM